jgi:hypothetical protein
MLATAFRSLLPRSPSVAGALGRFFRTFAQPLRQHARRSFSTTLGDVPTFELQVQATGGFCVRAQALMYLQMDCIDVPAAVRHNKTLIFLHG